MSRQCSFLVLHRDEENPACVAGFSYVRFWLPIQPVDATHAANRSAGVS
jgi:hypothetical protein